MAVVNWCRHTGEAVNRQVGSVAESFSSGRAVLMIGGFSRLSRSHPSLAACAKRIPAQATRASKQALSRTHKHTDTHTYTHTRRNMQTHTDTHTLCIQTAHVSSTLDALRIYHHTPHTRGTAINERFSLEKRHSLDGIKVTSIKL